MPINTQKRESVSQAADRIRQAAKRNPDECLVALFHHTTVPVLSEAFHSLKNEVAAGVDGVTWEMYAEGLENRLIDLHLTLAVILSVPSLVLADDETQQTVQNALPVMYRACASVVEEADGDETYILAVVEKKTALSIYNHQINIEDHASSGVDKTALHETFLSALAEGCAADKNTLLGGVVDNAVKSTLGL